MQHGIKIGQLLLISLCFFGLLPSSGAQVVINEFSVSNLYSHLDNFGRTEDWIELYNTSNTPVDISGYHLSDKDSKPMKWEIPQGTILQGSGHLLFYCSGRDGEFEEQYHTNFKLSQTSGKDIVLLSDPSGAVLERYDIELTTVEHSRGRIIDGGADWGIFPEATPEFENDESESFSAYTLAPTMDMEAGYYSGSVTVTITNNEPNSELRYTIDGTNPDLDSEIYSGPITLNETRVIKAQSFSLDPTVLTGKMDFNTYLIDEDYSLAVFSVAADDVQDLANGQGDLIPIGSIEYFNKDKEREAISYGSLNRHGQDSWVLTHRSLDWVSRDEMGYTKAINTKLFSTSERDEYQKIMFRNSGDDNYPAIGGNFNQGSTHIRDEYVQSLAQLGDMSLDVRSVERVVVFLNGDYWGVYGMRDRPVDHDYTDYHYDQGKYDVQYLTTWGITEVPYGGQQAVDDWAYIRDFIMDNDMSIPENYKIAEDSINMQSMIDYMLVNLNVVASDWLNYNTGWWRGLNPDGDHKKWGYILWDLDATFDFYINYSSVPNTDPDAVPCDLEDIAEYTDFWGQGYHGGLFLKLLDESPEFQQLYYGRYADLMNTVFSCENMTTVLDSMVATIRPEMPAQIARWGGSMQEWNSNLQDLRDFIVERCTLFDEGALQCYDELSGPYELTLMVEPNIGIGEIDISTLDIESFPWTGSYFGGTQTKIKARVFDDFDTLFQFSHWESSTGEVISPSPMDRKAEISVTQGGTLTAVFESLIEDIDQDGFGIDVDCNDLDASINPGAVEICDGIDNNCDGQIDEGIATISYYADNDGDGFGDPNSVVQDCGAGPAGYSLNNTDCDDNNAEINPSIEEIPNNGIDDDCDGEDLIIIIDDDNDGFQVEDDCDDNNPNIFPGALEICDGLDNNCDGQIDEGVQNEYFADMDGDGYGDANNIMMDCLEPEGFVSNDLDCDDNDSTINPDATEICDGIDNNCDGVIDEGFTFEIYYEDADSDGYGGGEGFESCFQPIDAIVIGGDCDDNDPTINPGATEISNNDIDENCDGLVEQVDVDEDGYNSDEDCDDNNGGVNPGAEDLTVNGVDENCDGVDGPSAIDDINDDQVKFFPNPFSNKLYIETDLENFQLILINVSGVEINKFDNKKSINLGALPDGIYFLKLKTENGYEVIKRIVKVS